MKSIEFTYSNGLDLELLGVQEGIKDELNLIDGDCVTIYYPDEIETEIAVILSTKGNRVAANYGAGFNCFWDLDEDGACHPMNDEQTTTLSELLIVTEH